jgi:predicted homoserine dehydrogenase-like protein
LIGLEVGISVASVGLRGESTGSPNAFKADVLAVAKRNLKFGEVLDGEGGYTVVGKLAPAEKSLKLGALPLGLAHGLKLKSDVAEGRPVTWNDVEFDAHSIAIKTRLAMESEYRS